MQKKRSIRDVELAGKKLLMRVDFNVPLDDQQQITEDTRIQAALPTITYAIEQGAIVVLVSHLGRPKGERKAEFSLAPVAKRLSELLGRPVSFLDDCIGEAAKNAMSIANDGDVLLLENVRFHQGETKNDPEFAHQLADGLDLFVNDAFGTAHRAHASNVGVAQYLSPAVAGFLIEKELQYFGQALENPNRPVAAILGGAKVSGKIEVINNLLQRVNRIIIGGGMMFTFLKVMGYEVGKSLVEEELLDVARNIIKHAKEKNVDLILPRDCIVAEKFEADAQTQLVNVDAIPVDWMGLDIGPESLKIFAEALRDAKTIIWNGPMGVFEMEAFSKGTVELAHLIARSEAISIIGGGDTVSAIKKAGVKEQISFVSTGGGASLELLEGKELPGIAALTDSE